MAKGIRPIIHLPEDENKCRELYEKQEEYLKRLHDPEPIAREKRVSVEEVLADTWCKYAIIKLLRGGKVEAREAWAYIKERKNVPVSQERLREEIQVSQELFRRAWFVIFDYVETGGKNVLRGTGFSKKKNDAATVIMPAEQQQEAVEPPPAGKGLTAAPWHGGKAQGGLWSRFKGLFRRSR